MDLAWNQLQHPMVQAQKQHLRGISMWLKHPFEELYLVKFGSSCFKQVKNNLCYPFFYPPILKTTQTGKHSQLIFWGLFLHFHACFSWVFPPFWASPDCSLIFQSGVPEKPSWPPIAQPNKDRRVPWPTGYVGNRRAGKFRSPLNLMKNCKDVSTVHFIRTSRI